MRTNSNSASGDITIFVCGDVMTGRGIDQILPHPGDPILYEGYIEDARKYVALAEQASGPIPRPVDFSYVWGDALEEWTRWAPDARVINLETSITTSREPWPKGINYRMHPKNLPCLTAAKIDACALANNHVADWGYDGLLETIDSLRGAGIHAPGAGTTLEEASAPATLEIPGNGRVLVFSLGSWSSGVPPAWAARPDTPGVFFFDEGSPAAVREILARVRPLKRGGDVALASVHWGENWGYAIPREHRAFAHALIEAAGIDLVHGHSSHHPKGIEVYAGHPILYGCGDFLNDYEGISGHEAYRSDLTLMYFVTLDAATGRLLRLSMVPLCLRKLRLNRVTKTDALWLATRLNQACEALDTSIELQQDGTLELLWC